MAARNHSSFRVSLFNAALTKKLFKLHASGYDLDFEYAGGPLITCVQDGAQFVGDAVLVILADIVFDRDDHSYKYVHTIDTGCGRKGIMILSGIFGLCCFSAFPANGFTERFNAYPLAPAGVLLNLPVR
ncbi:MAG: hypothetical protein JKY70_14110 [Mucilaginibacter sp.]|nr:hypothetical protein [Mucilaginibacter sp.]